MNKGSCFRKPFGRERVNESLKLLQSAEKYFCPTFSSFLANLSWKKSFLFRTEILGLLVNTLTANYEYCRNKSDNLPLPVPIQLSVKLMTFSWFFIAFFESTLNFEHFKQKISLIAQLFLKLYTPQRRVYLNA